MGVVKRFLGLFCACFASLVVVVCIRTWTFSVRMDLVSSCKPTDTDFIKATDAAVSRFRTALRYETVSIEPHVYNRSELVKLRNFIFSAFAKRLTVYLHFDQWLQTLFVLPLCFPDLNLTPAVSFSCICMEVQYIEAYPVVHSSPLVEYEVVANYSLLYTIKGSDPTLTPYMLTSHLDVVPADPQKWDSPPFDAEIIDGFIYGRGSLDDKHGVMATLEALEYLLSNGFVPQRALYIGFGHDEEVAGDEGAWSINELLISRGTKQLEFLIDEGLTVISGVVPGIDKPVALIGTSEKGQTVLELTVQGIPGHSSMPPKESTIGILSNAVARLESHPQPSMFGYGPEKNTFEHIAPEMDILHRVIMTNLWIFKPLVAWMLSRNPATNAIVRTVTSVTMFNAGIKNNVLPPSATAVVNHRIHPAQTVDQVIEIDRETIGDDRVQIKPIFKMEPLPISPCGDEEFGYQTVKNSIRQVWTEAVVAPGLMIANTDTRHYISLTPNIYRFSPTFMFPEDLKRFHGDNERLSVKNYEQAINFYYHLIRNADKKSLELMHHHGEEL